MKHQNGAIVGVKKLNPSVFQKTLINDFISEPDFDYPMGHLQLLGKSTKT